MKELIPRLYLVAGPNGAGKTTASMKLLPSLLDCDEFVNADEIARGLSPFHPESVAIAAGRLQLERIDYLLSEQKTFAIETTLSSSTYVKMFERGLKNFFNVYKDVVDSWMLYDNTYAPIRMIANRTLGMSEEILDVECFNRYLEYATK